MRERYDYYNLDRHIVTIMDSFCPNDITFMETPGQYGTFYISLFEPLDRLRVI